MAGIEVASVVPGIVPLLIAAVRTYGDVPNHAEATAFFDDLVKMRGQHRVGAAQTNALSPEELSILDREFQERARRAIELHKKQKEIESSAYFWSVNLLRVWLTEGEFMKQAFSTMLVVGTLGGGKSISVRSRQFFRVLSDHTASSILRALRTRKFCFPDPSDTF